MNIETRTALIKALMPLIAAIALAFGVAKVIGGSFALYSLIFIAITAVLFWKDSSPPTYEDEHQSSGHVVGEDVNMYEAEDEGDHELRDYTPIDDED